MRQAFVAMIIFQALLGCQKTDKTATNIPKPAELAVATENDDKLWVKDDHAERRTYPSIHAPSVGKLYFREAATPFEQKNGWIRVSKYYSAACEAGQNQYVKAGDKACTADNGLRPDGTFAEWIRSEQLVKDRPADPADDAQSDEKVVAQSDDFRRFHHEFALAADQLISKGRCTKTDLIEQGGFVKSVTEHPDEPVYFTYCGGMTNASKIYFNAKTRKFL